MNNYDYEKYRKYLFSDEWEENKQPALNRVNAVNGYGTCERCGKHRKLDCHHLNYDYLYHEADHPECLLACCRQCHEKIHQEKTDRKLDKRFGEMQREIDELKRGSSMKVIDEYLRAWQENYKRTHRQPENTEKECE